MDGANVRCIGFKESLSIFEMLSELYVADAPKAMLLPEYPSSNNADTNFRNSTQFVIHDPFPPPKRSLMKVLGPHHLMCCWGDQIAVTSEVRPPDLLTEHWRQVFGDSGCPHWIGWQTDSAVASSELITLFPHEAISQKQQVVDPEVLHHLHSKEVIAEIDCPQAKVLGNSLQEIHPPCLVKLSHGYAGLGNYFVHDSADAQRVAREITIRWPDASVVVNEIIQDVVGDYGVQFYLGKDGSIVCLGLTEQKFVDGKWSGGHFVSELQEDLLGKFDPIIRSTASCLHRHEYFGVVGIDILLNQFGKSFLVDVNPRLTGITPFLIASRLFLRHGIGNGVYRASFEFPGDANRLFGLVNRLNHRDDVRVLVLAVWEDPESEKTSCHISVSGQRMKECLQMLDQLIVAEGPFV